MKRESHPKIAICIAVLLLAAGSAIASSQAPEATLSGDSLTWSLASDRDGATLRISGQGVLIEREFARGALLSQGALDNEGDQLPDGNYTWEISFVAPTMSAADQRDLRASQEGLAVDRAQHHRGESYSGAFSILDGAILDPALSEASGANGEMVTATEAAMTTTTLADQQILDDLIVQGSACIGQDCVNGESFGFDTLRLKENNLRIKFQDTSSSASFPSNDWQLTANETTNGGANKFSIDDIDNGRTPFTIEASAPSHSLYVDDGGRLGLGTSTPVVDIHIKSGNTPTLRLEQDGSSGFTSQTWDVAGNEAGFFVRDATHSSSLPFRILPNAPSEALVIEGGGDVGVGTGTNPAASLHVRRTNGSARVFVEDTFDQTATDLLELSANGNPRMIWRDTDAGLFWRLSSETNATEFVITRSGTSNREFVIDADGNVEARGTITASVATPFTLPDYVFEPEYELMPLDELETYIQENKRLPKVPSAQQVFDEGLNMTDMQIRLLEKIEELTLYTLEQQKLIGALEARLEAVEETQP